MFSTHELPTEQRRGIRLAVQQDGVPLTYHDFLRHLQDTAEFRSDFNAQLADCQFSAFRWETPPVHRDSLRQPFEFILLYSPELDRHPEPEAFADHFQSAASGSRAVAFWNLGKNAKLVVPCPLITASAYGHLAAFVREAPSDQQHEFWKLVGRTVEEELSDAPLWLSTAGAGVTWLHVRLDQRPKYYGYAPYRSWPWLPAI